MHRIPLIQYDRPPPAPDLMGPEGLNLADAYGRVSAALLADKACVRCMGKGFSMQHIPYSLREERVDCPDCRGTGTVTAAC